MLELPNFGNITLSTVKFESHDNILLVTSWTRFDAITFISKYFILRRSRVANFAGIIKIATMFIKRTFKGYLHYKIMTSQNVSSEA